MADIARRRQLVQDNIEDFDCCVTYDVNEYLIEAFPTLTYKQRQSVWSINQNNEDFDWSSVEEQLDNTVYELAENDPNVVLPDTDDSEDEDDSSFYDNLWYALEAYLQSEYDDWDDEELSEVIDLVIENVSNIVDEYYDEDDDTDEDQPTG